MTSLKGSVEGSHEGVGLGIGPATPTERNGTNGTTTNPERDGFHLLNAREKNALPSRFWDRVLVTDGCWLWRTPREDGYGRIQIGWTRKRAHVWTWEAINGPVPEGLVLDHLCRNRACVRLDHLRAVTPRDNTHAPGSLAIAKAHADRTHCPKSHPYSEENTRVAAGKRRCRTCINAARRAKRAAR